MKSAKLLILVSLLFTVLPEARAFTLGGGDSNLLGWQTKELTFAVNYTGCDVSNAVMDAAIDTAFALWNGVPTSNLKLVRGGTSTSTPAQLIAGTATDSPVIACDAAFAADTGQSADSVAGVGTFGASNSTIIYGFLLMNNDPTGAAAMHNLDATSQAVIMAHEIGHVLGLGHSGDTKALMYYDATAKTNLSLSQDDVDGMTYLYPRKELSGDKLFGCGSLAVIGANGANLGGGNPPTIPPGALELCALTMLVAIATRLQMRRHF